MKKQLLKAIAEDIIFTCLSIFIVVGIGFGIFYIIEYIGNTEWFPNIGGVFLLATIGNISLIAEMFFGYFINMKEVTTSEEPFSISIWGENYWLAYLIMFSLISWWAVCKVLPTIQEYVVEKKRIVEFQIREREEYAKINSRKTEEFDKLIEI